MDVQPLGQQVGGGLVVGFGDGGEQASGGFGDGFVAFDQ